MVDVKFRGLKRRMAFIKEKLDEAKNKRELYHQQRLKTGMPIVSLVGYTGAGKTTLFNLLSAQQKETSASLFTTLSTTTRSMKIEGKKVAVLLTDTVGFISRLPTYMIDAFKSTLEESLAADLILLLIDSSEELENIKIKYYNCWNVLKDLKVDESKVSVILTKYDYDNDNGNNINNVADGIDGMQKIDVIAKDLQLKDPLLISSKTGYGIHRLKNTIMALLKNG